MTDLPDPPIDHDVDLTDFPFMPLQVQRLRDSKFASIEDAEGFRCGVLLWCASWHQVPAASLPDDEKELAKLAGLGRDVKTWRQVKVLALYNWVKCSDGRFYHPVIVEAAKSASARRYSAVQKGAKGAASKWGKSGSNPSDHQLTRSQRLAEARQIATHTHAEWEGLLLVCGDICLRCGASGPFVKDHVTPIYQGGSDGIDNLQPLCKRCNSSKGPEVQDYRPSDWRERLAERLANLGVLTGIQPDARNGKRLTGPDSNAWPTPGKGERQGERQGERREISPERHTHSGAAKASDGHSEPTAIGSVPGLIDMGSNLTRSNAEISALTDATLEAWRNEPGVNPEAMTAWIDHCAALAPTPKILPAHVRLNVAKALAGFGDFGVQSMTVQRCVRNNWKNLQPLPAQVAGDPLAPKSATAAVDPDWRPDPADDDPREVAERAQEAARANR